MTRFAAANGYTISRVAVTLEDLERHVVVGDARHAEHVALRFGIRRRPLGAVLVAFGERVGPVRNRPVTYDASPCWNRGDRAELPELVQGFRRMTLQIPVRRVQRLPDAVEIGMPGHACRTFQLRLSWSGTDGAHDRCRHRERSGPSIQPVSNAHSPACA